jgi:hypothetical protein
MPVVGRRRPLLPTVRWVTQVQAASMVPRLASCLRRQHVSLLLAICRLLSVPLLATMNLKSSPKKRTPKPSSQMQCPTPVVRRDDLRSLIVTNMIPSKFRHKRTRRLSVLLVTCMLRPQYTISRSMISASPRVRYYHLTTKTWDSRNLRLPASSSAQLRTRAAMSGLVRKMATCMSST